MCGPSPQPTKVELVNLNVLWEQGPGMVRMLALFLFVGIPVCLAIAGDKNNKRRENGLVFWNTFDSKKDIYNSRVGAGGVYRGEGGSFVEGVAGKALQLNYEVYEAVAFPKEVVPIDAGCIEFWAKMSNLPEALPAGQRPCLIQAWDGKSTYGIHFNGNDGFGDGGLCGWAGEGGHCGTGDFGNWRYESILGKGQVDTWHHYALVWDKQGLTGAAQGKKFAVFLDGRLKTGRWRDDGNTVFEPLTGGELKLHVKHDSLGQGTITYDELKIWDYAKTSFDDRFPAKPDRGQ